MPSLMPRGVRRSVLLLATILSAWCFATDLGAAVEQTTVFSAGAEGYKSFRIPAIIKAPGGDLLAFAEGRKNGPGDSGDIDLIMKRSSDGGKTWGALQVLWDDAENTCGNPCPVIDASTGTIWLLTTHNPGSEKESGIAKGESAQGRTVWVLSSRDRGATWSKPLNITSSVKLPTWTWYATGPGVGIQIQQGAKAGRLVIPCDNNVRPAKGEKPVRASHVIYSDDHGASWKAGASVGPDMNECQVAELYDGKGTLLLDMRSYRGRSQRAQSRSSDGGEIWTAPVDVPALVEPVCQASLLRWDKGGNRPDWLLFSNPADPKKRRNLTVRASADDAGSWPRQLVLHEGPAAYSCLVIVDERTAGCLYEGGERAANETIRFARFAASDLAP